MTKNKAKRKPPKKYTWSKNPVKGTIDCLYCGKLSHVRVGTDYYVTCEKCGTDRRRSRGLQRRIYNEANWFDGKPELSRALKTPIPKKIKSPVPGPVPDDEDVPGPVPGPGPVPDDEDVPGPGPGPDDEDVQIPDPAQEQETEQETEPGKPEKKAEKIAVLASVVAFILYLII